MSNRHFHEYSSALPWGKCGVSFTHKADFFLRTFGLPCLLLPLSFGLPAWSRACGWGLFRVLVPWVFWGFEPCPFRGFVWRVWSFRPGLFGRSHTWLAYAGLGGKTG